MTRIGVALAFLILSGVMLIADSVGRHIPKGYIYAPMAFALAIEVLNLRTSACGPPLSAEIESRSRWGGGRVG